MYLQNRIKVISILSRPNLVPPNICYNTSSVQLDAHGTMSRRQLIAGQRQLVPKWGPRCQDLQNSLAKPNRETNISLCATDPAKESQWRSRLHRDFQRGLRKALISPDEF